MPDPVTDPEDDPDPKRLRILRGLPRGTLSAEIVYKANSRLNTTEGFRETKVDLDDAEQYLDDALEAAGYTDHPLPGSA